MNSRVILSQGLMDENQQAKRYRSLENTSYLSGCFFLLLSDLKLEAMPLYQPPKCSGYRCGHQARLLFLSFDL